MAMNWLQVLAALVLLWLNATRPIVSRVLDIDFKMADGSSVCVLMLSAFTLLTVSVM